MARQVRQRSITRKSYYSHSEIEYEFKNKSCKNVILVSVTFIETSFLFFVSREGI